jgi:outer membrane autotransporter protein
MNLFFLIHFIPWAAALLLICAVPAQAYTATVDAGSTVTGEAINGGRQFVYGTASDTLLSGGIQYVHPGGSVNRTTVAGGELTVLGRASDTVMQSGQAMIARGGQADGLTMTGGLFQVNGILNHAVVSGGTMFINKGDNGLVDPCTGGRMNNVSLTNATLQNRFGVDTGTVVNEGAVLLTGNARDHGWNNTGISENATVNTGGQQIVDNGATSIGSTVNPGGQLVVRYTLHDEFISDDADPARGTARDSIIRGQMHNLGGLDTGTVIQSGGLLQLSGNAVDGFRAESHRAVIESGGSAVLGQDTRAADWLVQGFAHMSHNTALLQNSTVDSGGVLQMDAGHAQSLTVNGGGQVQLHNARLTDASVSGYVSTGPGSTLEGAVVVNSGGVVEIDPRAGTAHAAVTLGGHLHLNHSAIAPAGADFTLAHLNMNGGDVIFGAASGAGTPDIVSTLTVGTLSGSGAFYMNTALAGLRGNFLRVSGQAEGVHQVYVADTGVSPAHEDSLQLVQTGGGSADFRLGNTSGVVDVGTWQYEMVSDGQGGWFLAPKADGADRPGPVIPQLPQTPQLPEIILPQTDYRVTPATAGVLSMASATPLVFSAGLQTLQNRLAHARTQASDDNLWGLVSMGQQRVDTGRSDYRMDIAGVTFGLERTDVSEYGSLVQGVAVDYRRADVDFSRGGTGRLDAYTLGGYMSWLHHSGFYLDGMVKAGHFRHEVRPRMTSGATVSGHYSVKGMGASLEGGQYFDTGYGYIAPFVGVGAFISEPRSYGLSNGMRVQVDKQASLSAFAGVRVGGQWSVQGIVLEPWAGITLAQELVDGNQVTVNRDRLSNDLSGTRGIYQAGINAWMSERVKVQLEASYLHGRRIEAPWTLHAGLSYAF